ncbi:class III lanthionine synthetase LanKC [Salinispora vitiensis]|uniref:class III lanthionine synthetase LanKC n=1 Tax=Salinispora vitiensis TaxID=999544 RepID=UPI000371F0A3|nr:class III lanthionine synthetase LanKC [Salinispora vitiensis]
MLDQYPPYTFADPLFYDSPANIGPESDYEAAARPAPAGWRRTRRQVWVNLDPAEVELPTQGWKIHLSATLANAARVLDVAWGHCVDNRIPFKFLPNERLLRIFNAKYMPRQSSGKFVVLYPVDVAQLRSSLGFLAEELAGEPGPQILSDLRWGSGPVFIRYGGFRERHCTTPDGEAVPAIERPDGIAEPDLRRPVFQTPPWLAVPDFITKRRAERPVSRAVDFPYRVERALHFSNGGGVYLAERDDGVQVILKEARPHAALDRAGRDAVQRIGHEHQMLRRLDGIAGVPRVYDYLVVEGHHFLVLERMPGEVIWKWTAAVHPMVDAAPSDLDRSRYAQRALRLSADVDRILDDIHARGVIYGDLHPGNILVTTDDKVSLIDFEVCGEVDDTSYTPGLGAAGFTPGNHDISGLACDDLASAALSLWLFLALDRLWELDPDKLRTSIDHVVARYPLPDAAVERLRRTLLGGPSGAEPSLARTAARGRPQEVDLAAEPDLGAVCQSLADAILLSATPERHDRLFPGDIRQFSEGGATFAHGAAGVLWALDQSGFGRFPDHEDWLIRAASEPLVPRPGFFTGLHGIAHVLDHFGHRTAALDLVGQAIAPTAVVQEPDLYRGLGGIGLNLLHLSQRTGSADLRAMAVDVTQRVADALELATRSGKPRPAGLLDGWSGPALLFVRMHQATGDSGWLDLAVRAVHRDLDRCVVRPDGTMLAGEMGGRALPYLRNGSAGVGLVVDEVLRHREDERLRESLSAVHNVFLPEYVAESNLLDGRAGLLAVAARMSLSAPGEPIESAIAQHIRRLSWYAVSYRGHLAFPGRQQLRLSMDLATGNAGVMLAVTAARHRKTSFLPFLSLAAVT